MENLSKILSLVAGIFVIIIIFVILQNRYNLRSRISWLSTEKTQQKITPSTTPTSRASIGAKSGPTPIKSEPTPKKTTVFKTVEKTQPTPTKKAKQPTFTKGGETSVKSIPSTGPTLLIPLAFSAFASGLYLRKRNK